MKAPLCEPERRLWASVPEALPAARVGIVPAQVRTRRRARPRGRSSRADEPGRRPRRARAAGAPPIPAGPRPIAVVGAAAVNAAAVNAAAVNIGVAVDI